MAQAREVERACAILPRGPGHRSIIIALMGHSIVSVNPAQVQLSCLEIQLLSLTLSFRKKRADSNDMLKLRSA
jgi:hypothetical protein